jgi:hypothetical protein
MIRTAYIAIQDQPASGLLPPSRAILEADVAVIGAASFARASI